jgi:hypothetical protein
MTDTLAKSVEKFIEKKYRRKKDRETVAKLLIGSAVGPDNSYVFLQQPSVRHLASQPVASREVVELIPIAIKDSVSSYTRKKLNLINIYKQYIDFLQSEYGIKVDIKFPPVFNNDFDRQMYIIKSLHQRRYSAAELGEELWLSERTITNDLVAMEDGISILGQQMRITRVENVYHQKGLNTIHPIFLSANLTQVVVMLKGLESQAQDQAYREYAVRLAANIWRELSDYGRQRILDIYQKLNLNPEWFDLLEERRNNSLYSSEAGCSYEQGAGNVLDYLKNGKPCTIEIRTGKNTKILADCRIRDYSGDEITVEHASALQHIPIKSVVKVTRYSQEIF